jgi:transcriptional regulator with XRE-family HTH domain
LGVSHQQIQNYESGTDGLSAAKVLRLAEILGVNVSHFYHASVRADLDD